MEVIIKKIFIFICISMLSIPLIFVTLRIKVEDRYSSKKINGNFERNFPLKDDLYSLYAILKENFFEVNSIPEKAIDLRKDGWLFCGDSFSDNLSESFKLVNFSNKDITTLEVNLQNKNNWSKTNNIKYLIAVAPNKETYYSNLIPIKKSNNISKTDQIQSVCKKTGVRFIDLGEKYPSKPKHILYHKTDTHWNEYAGYFGYKSILNALNLNYSLGLKPISESKIKIAQSNLKIGDLNEMLRRDLTENLVCVKITNYKPIAKEVPKKLNVPEGYQNDPLAYERRYKANNKPLKILVLSDSFGGYFINFLKEHFCESVFIWSHRFDKELILKEKPDIIIQEFVERNIDYLLLPEN